MAEKRGLTPFVRLALAGIRGYQILVRPLLTGSCRYLPTCSEYAAQAIGTHGVLRGGWLALKRVLRCHPFGGAGLDPVPSVASPKFVEHRGRRCARMARREE